MASINVKVDNSSALWCSADTILWRVAFSTRDLREYRLYFDPQGLITVQKTPTPSSRQTANVSSGHARSFSSSSPGNLSLNGGSFIRLEPDLKGPSQEILQRYPHLQKKPSTSFSSTLTSPQPLKLSDEYLTLRLPQNHQRSSIGSLLKCQLLITLWEKDIRDLDSPTLINFSGLQLPGVLDNLFGHYSGSLGVVFQLPGADRLNNGHCNGVDEGEDTLEEEENDVVPTLKLWAPTARSVLLHLFNNPSHLQFKDGEVRHQRESRLRQLQMSHRNGSDPSLSLPITNGNSNHKEEVEEVMEVEEEQEKAEIVPMVEDPNTGVWQVRGREDWLGKYYLYEIDVFVPRANRFSRHLTTDPYSISLSANGERSQIVDLRRDAKNLPSGWDGHRLNTLQPRHPADAVIYELHIRDFSVADLTVPPNLRGTYLAFANRWSKDEIEQDEMEQNAFETNGMKHLRSLAESGLNYIHLLPSFDFASVDERTVAQERRKGTQPLMFPTSENDSQKKGHTRTPSSLQRIAKSQSPKINFSEEPQANVRELNIKGNNPHNWGYDPVHWLCPEGSYSTSPDGPQRISEYRRMVMGLHEAGLGVVLDVVFNHCSDLNGSLIDKERMILKPREGDGEPVSEDCFGSILERVVPGYYHRMDMDGRVERSACGLNTATEHHFMQKLMIDACKFWVKNYKVDGFRFDLMGHHMKKDLTRLRQVLDAQVSLERDGVDGKGILIYGEGWDFGEVANNARGVNAAQENMSGTGIGTFNDRFRDAVRGGSAFGPKRAQGFASGLFVDPNEETQSTATELEEQKDQLLTYGDWIKAGLTGNLSEFILTDKQGKVLPAKELEYSNGRPVGYCSSPSENVIYISAHDNETLFDALQMKLPTKPQVSSSSSPPLTSLPSTSEAIQYLQSRVRMQCLANSLVMFAQGMSFFHAGDDFLRSKSMDRNSYSSGDWFNSIDWSFQNCGWGRGLPPCEENEEYWDFMRGLLADPLLAPRPSDLMFCHKVFCEHLRVRRSCSHFRMRSQEEIKKRLHFRNCGPDQIPGLIVMEIQGGEGEASNSGSSRGEEGEIKGTVIVFFNANKSWIEIRMEDLIGKEVSLHPVLRNSVDEVVRQAKFDTEKGVFMIPGRTTAVFVRS